MDFFDRNSRTLNGARRKFSRLKLSMNDKSLGLQLSGQLILIVDAHQIVIIGNDQIEVFGEHRPAIESVPTRSHSAAETKHDFAAFQQFANLGTAPAADHQLKTEERR